jgi:UDP-N-acetylmuramate dehydrogenase
MTLALEERASLQRLNAFGVPATAAWLARVRGADDLLQLAQNARLAGLPTLILGAGTNVLFVSDFDGVVIRIEVAGLQAVGETGDARLFEVGAGVDWHWVVQSLLDRGIGGLENLALIPGTAGAGPVQNIGAYGVELAERLHSVRVWDRETGGERQMTPAECEFGYRDSVFKSRLAGRAIILAVTLALPKRWQPVLGYAELDRELKGRAIERPGAQDVFDAVCAVRRRKLPDPALIGNAGSFFKNPVVSREQCTDLIARFPSMVTYGLAGGRFKLAAGWLIEACGLKGATRGRAGVYERQALVLVNRGGASGRDILDLAREIQARVSEKFGVWLEPEAVIV